MIATRNLNRAMVLGQLQEKAKGYFFPSFSLFTYDRNGTNWTLLLKSEKPEEIINFYYSEIEKNNDFLEIRCNGTKVRL